MAEKTMYEEALSKYNLDISDEEVKELLMADADADAMCEAAIKAGGFDNVSVIVAKVEK